ncbi:MAG: nitroreductase family protein [Janthinobacterium lividum]
MNKPAETSTPIDPLLAGRWSPRALSREVLDKNEIAALLEAARWAPSAYNVQPWRFIVWNRAEDKAAYDKAFAALVPFNQGWVEPANLLVGVFAHTLNAKGEVNRTAPYDAGAAAFSLVLQAHAQGLAAHQMSGFDPNKIRESFAIPSDVEVIALIAIGRYGSTDALDAALREREVGPRSRLPLAEVAYSGAWGKGF